MKTDETVVNIYIVYKYIYSKLNCNFFKYINMSKISQYIAIYLYCDPYHITRFLQYTLLLQYYYDSLIYCTRYYTKIYRNILLKSTFVVGTFSYIYGISFSKSLKFLY